MTLSSTRAQHPWVADALFLSVAGSQDAGALAAGMYCLHSAIAPQLEPLEIKRLAWPATDIQLAASTLAHLPHTNHTHAHLHHPLGGHSPLTLLRSGHCARSVVACNKHLQAPVRKPAHNAAIAQQHTARKGFARGNDVLPLVVKTRKGSEAVAGQQ